MPTQFWKLPQSVLPQRVGLVPWLLLGGLLYRTFCAIWLFPGFDEAYYFEYSRHLDWSYFDHPMLVALTTGFGVWLTGIISPLTIRLGALLLYTLSLWLLYRTAARLFSEAAGELTLAIATLVPLFLIGFGLLTSPENSLIFFWTATLYWATCEFFPAGINARDRTPYRPSWRIGGLGVLLGLACLGKYHGFILGLGLVGFCLTSHRYRRALWSPWTAVALILFGLTLFPLWFWNLNHDWISFRFQLSMRFEDSESSFSGMALLLTFLVGIAYLFPTLGIPLWGVGGKALVQQARAVGFPPLKMDPDPRRRQAFILWVSLPIALGFTILGGSKPILPGWPAPGFWGLTLLLGYYAHQWQTTWSRRGVRRWLVGSGACIAVLLLIALSHVSAGVFQKGGRYAPWGGFLPIQQDDSTQLVDVLQLSRQFGADQAVQAALQEVGFLFTNQYYLGGYIDMAIRPHTDLPLTTFGPDMRGYAFWYDSSQWVGQDGLYITNHQSYQDPQWIAGYRAYFEELEEIATLPLYRGGQVSDIYHVFRARRLLKPYPPSPFPT